MSGARGHRGGGTGGSGRDASAARGGRPGAPRGRGGQGGAGRGGSQGGQGARGGRPGGARRGPAPEPVDVHDPDGVRLQKVLAQAGLGSRRACEELVSSGRVTVDGQVVVELGVRVDPTKAVLHVDGMRVQLDTSLVTIALNKPLGVVSTMHDPEGRPSLAQLVADREERLFHIGRLDAESEGLILLTNDGELANRLAHPRHGVPKTYLADVEGRVPANLAARLKRGIELDDGPAAVDEFRVVQTTPQASLVEVVIHEGRNRIVRRLMEQAGHPVTRLVRTKVGPIRLGDLRPGRNRVLSRTEVGSLMASVGM